MGLTLIQTSNLCTILKKGVKLQAVCKLGYSWDVQKIEDGKVHTIRRTVPMVIDCDKCEMSDFVVTMTAEQFTKETKCNS